MNQPLFAELPAVGSDGVVLFTRFLPGSYRNALALLDELDEFLAAR